LQRGEASKHLLHLAAAKVTRKAISGEMFAVAEDDVVPLPPEQRHDSLPHLHGVRGVDVQHFVHLAVAEQSEPLHRGNANPSAPVTPALFFDIGFFPRILAVMCHPAVPQVHAMVIEGLKPQEVALHPHVSRPRTAVCGSSSAASWCRRAALSERAANVAGRNRGR